MAREQIALGCAALFALLHEDTDDPGETVRRRAWHATACSLLIDLFPERMATLAMERAKHYCGAIGKELTDGETSNVLQATSVFLMSSEPAGAEANA